MMGLGLLATGSLLEVTLSSVPWVMDSQGYCDTYGIVLGPPSILLMLSCIHVCRPKCVSVYGL